MYDNFPLKFVINFVIINLGLDSIRMGSAFGLGWIRIPKNTWIHIQCIPVRIRNTEGNAVERLKPGREGGEPCGQIEHLQFAPICSRHSTLHKVDPLNTEYVNNSEHGELLKMFAMKIQHNVNVS
jgi:hypothetical protein